MCPENPGPRDVLGRRCWSLAEDIANRFDAPIENFSWMTYPELERVSLQLGVLGVLNDASILPSLALNEDPMLVLEALKQAACNNEVEALGVLVLGGSQANSNPYIGVGTVAVGVGITLGIGGLLAANALGDILFTKRGRIENEYSRQAKEIAREQNIDPCDWLAQLYRSVSNKAERQKIKQAQKALNCRRHR